MNRLLKNHVGGILLLAVVLIILPLFGDISLQLDVSMMMVLALLGLSMGIMWGYGGILSFGQTIFFGLSGYAYAIFSLNQIDPTLSLVVSVVLSGAFAAALGYFMIYGRISQLYLSIVTLVVTLIFEKGIRATSGPQFKIGQVRLNGQNGIPNIPGLEWLAAWAGGNSILANYYLFAFGLLVTFAFLIWLIGSNFGRVLIGIRENKRRMGLLGYDTRVYELGIFTVAGCVAGLSGVFYALWGNLVAPNMFGLYQAAMVVVWVLVGGRNYVWGAIVGVVIIQYLSTWLGMHSTIQISLIMGVILIAMVLLFPNGLIGAWHELKIYITRGRRGAQHG